MGGDRLSAGDLGREVERLPAEQAPPGKVWTVKGAAASLRFWKGQSKNTDAPAGSRGFN